MHYTRKIIFDLFLFSFSYVISFLLRFDLINPSIYLIQIAISFPIVITLRIITFCFFKIYNDDYNFFSSTNALSILKAITVSSIIIYGIFFTFSNFFYFPKTIIIIDSLLLYLLISSTRLLIRKLRHGTLIKSKSRKPLLIVGSGYEAESILREMKSYNHYGYSPIGLIDDNPNKLGKTIHGVKILGNTKKIPEIIKDKKVETLLIAIPSASKKQIKAILNQCRDLRIKIITMPPLQEIDKDKQLFNQLKELKPEDLLFRKKIEWDNNEVITELIGKKIAVTGAGGSIGSELCRQIAKYNPQELILLERSEYDLFKIDKELNYNFPNLSIRPLIVDVTDLDIPAKIVEKYKPHIIFHAAAYKHVTLGELNPEIIIKNNIVGTMNLAQAAIKNKVDKFVFISTDKAVNPTCVMGASKRICEEYILSIAQITGNNFYSVRFGNVLGSSGSVLQIFEEQVAQGGPVTVSHYDAYRYFITIPEAVQLVLQTIRFEKAGDMFILDMGEPVRIYDLAKKVISQAGFKVDEDIKIVFTGLRQGEKIAEDLFDNDEKLEPTPHKKILKIICNNNHRDLTQLNNDIDELLQLSKEMNRPALFNKLKQMLPNYSPSNAND